MFGKTTLNEVREKLRKAISADGDDPISWLDKRIKACKDKGSSTRGEIDVLQSLRRLLEPPEKAKRH